MTMAPAFTKARSAAFGMIVALASMTAMPAFAETVVVRGLDKVSGTAKNYAVPVNKPVRIGQLEIVARACSKAAPEETPEVKAFLEISDLKAKADKSGNLTASAKDKKQLFSGWMFASSPALNALEHPVYDVWVIDCRS